MSEMMTFPDTWEEFEKLYGFNDAEEIYTNNSRLIPSFRVKQWLDHLSSVQPKERCIATITLSKEDIERIVREQVEEIKEMLPRNGKWIYGEHDVAMCDGYRCDKCGFFVPWDYQRRFIDFIKDYNYCPSCGADMEVKNDYPSSHNIAEEP